MALSPAQKQQAYRDRKHATRIAMLAEATQAAEALLRVELAGITERRSIALEIERRDREAEELAARVTREAEELAARQAADAARRAEEARRQGHRHRGRVPAPQRPPLGPERASQASQHPDIGPRDGGGGAEGRNPASRGLVQQDRGARARPGWPSAAGRVGPRPGLWPVGLLAPGLLSCRGRR